MTDFLRGYIALAAGGTGGHVMPALAVAEALRERAPGLDVRFFCGSREQELGWIREAGFSPVALPAAPLGGGVIKKSMAWGRAGQALLRCRRIFKTDRPLAVAGFGGYASGPCVLAATFLEIPTLIHEQNALAGKTNRWVARRVSAVATTYPDAFSGMAFGGGKERLTGNPLRRRALVGPPPAQARREFGLDETALTVLVCGGSQGAQRLNEALLQLFSRFDASAPPLWQVLWITGSRHFDSVNAKLEGLAAARPMVRAVPFVAEMGRAYAAADLAIVRAGSASLAEVAAWGLPAIVSPFPFAAEDHQRLNARFFEKDGACTILEDADMSVENLRGAIDSIVSDPARRDRMGQAARRLAKVDAANAVADAIWGLASGSAG